MSETQRAVRQFVLETVRALNRGKSNEIAAIEDSCNLVDAGLVDSIGFLELVSAVEAKFGVRFDFSAADPAEFTTLGGFVAHAVPSRQERGS
jgi:acyl carrier protein